jgi:hypothetical protein
MQQEISAMNPLREVQILGVNQIGRESGIGEMSEGRTIPLCQDEDSLKVWISWHVTYRDVFILDRENDGRCLQSHGTILADPRTMTRSVVSY